MLGVRLVALLDHDARRVAVLLVQPLPDAEGVLVRDVQVELAWLGLGLGLGRGLGLANPDPNGMCRLS